MTINYPVFAADKDAFTSLLKFEPFPGQELRADETTTDRYHGRNLDGADTAAATWEIVRFYKDTSGNITRARYRTGVAWDSRTAGW